MDLQYNIETKKNGSKVASFSVSSTEIQPKMEQKFKDYQKRISLEGFRKGKVPRQLIKRMYGKSIDSEVFQPYLNEAWNQLFKDEKFDIIGTPGIENIKYNAKEGLSFDIIFETRPEIKLDGYDDFEVEKVIYEAGDEQVQAILKSFQGKNAMIYTVEGEAQKGHILEVDVQELDRTGVPMIGKKQTDNQIWLTDDNPLTEQLIGIKAGEERRVHIVSERPKLEIIEERNKEQAVEAHYLVKVLDVKERKLPELDDEFAKDMGSFETLDELKGDIWKNLKAHAELEGKNLFRRSLADELIKSHDFDVSASMVEHYLDAMIKDLRKEYKGNPDFDEQQLRDYYRASSIRNIKWYLIQDQLVKAENINVPDEEVEERIKEIEESENNGAERVKKIREDNKERKSLMNSMLEDKVYDFLASKAKINEVTKPWKALDDEKQEKEEKKED